MNDQINPKHYRSHPSGVECIQITEHMSFSIGNAMKYLWRAGLKTDDPTQDLLKAAWYVRRELQRIGQPGDPITISPGRVESETENRHVREGYPSTGWEPKPGVEYADAHNMAADHSQERSDDSYLQSQMRSLMEWHETKAMKARNYPGEDVHGATQRAKVHDTAASRIADLLNGEHE